MRRARIRKRQKGAETSEKQGKVIDGVWLKLVALCVGVLKVPPVL